MIRFFCEHCGQKISVPKINAGKKGKCPKCKSVVVVPGPDGSNSVTGRSDSELRSGVSGIDASLFDIPQKSETAEESIPQHRMTDNATEGPQELKERTGIAEPRPQGATESRLPWLVDVFLYPFSLGGIIHLIFLWLLIFLLCPLVMALMGLGTEYIPVVYLLPVTYVLYYFAQCIRDSAAGGRRPPDFWMHPASSDRWDCVSQSLFVLASIAVCFWPAVVYYAVTGGTGLTYWLLLACGGFLFPMALLAAVLFDSFNALNPILIIGSIWRTLAPYCGMVLFFYAGALLFMEIDSPVNRFWLLPAVPFILTGVQFYMIFVAVGFLGRFYRRYENKLNWEV